MEKLTPRFRRKPRFISWDKFNYLLFNSSLVQYINDHFDYPTAVNVALDEERRILRFTFNSDGNGFCFSSNGTGAGRKSSFVQGTTIPGFEHKRYYELEYGEGFIDLRY